MKSTKMKREKQKIKEKKNYFFEKINKINKPLNQEWNLNRITDSNKSREKKKIP